MTPRPPLPPLKPLLLLALSLSSTSHAFIPPLHLEKSPSFTTGTPLQMMGIIDFLKTNNPFLNSREGDFIPLDRDSTENDDSVGPPLVVLYAVPNSIEMEEYRDMVCDGMPDRRLVDDIDSDDNGVVMIRCLEGMDENGMGGQEVLDFSVEDALNRLVQGEDAILPSPPSTAPAVVTSPASIAKEGPCPVLYFSGVSNKEMMDTYNIIANEIYEETNGVHWPACAKVVPPALNKSMRQVLSEISGDHADAMRPGKEEEEE